MSVDVFRNGTLLLMHSRYINSIASVNRMLRLNVKRHIINASKFEIRAVYERFLRRQKVILSMHSSSRYMTVRFSCVSSNEEGYDCESF